MRDKPRPELERFYAWYYGAYAGLLWLMIILNALSIIHIELWLVIICSLLGCLLSVFAVLLGYDLLRKRAK